MDWYVDPQFLPLVVFNFPGASFMCFSVLSFTWSSSSIWLSFFLFLLWVLIFFFFVLLFVVFIYFLVCFSSSSSFFLLLLLRLLLLLVLLVLQVVPHSGFYFKILHFMTIFFVLRRRILDKALYLTYVPARSLFLSPAAVQQAACAMLVAPGSRSRPCKIIKACPDYFLA